MRSARITDIDLFAQYGKPAFGYSGAQQKMFPYIKAASIYDVSPYTGRRVQPRQRPPHPLQHVLRRPHGDQPRTEGHPRT